MIPSDLLQEILQDPFYTQCVRWQENQCQGRITFEHAWIYASKQIQEKWAIIPCCAYHHEVDEFQDCGDLDKEKNQWYALQRATKAELAAYPRKNWAQIKAYLSGKFGKDETTIN